MVSEEEEVNNKCYKKGILSNQLIPSFDKFERTNNLLCKAYEVGLLCEAYEVGLLCEAYEVGFCAKPMKTDWTLFSPRNNNNHNNHPQG